jgi:hypothetical protein
MLSGTGGASMRSGLKTSADGLSVPFVCLALKCFTSCDGVLYDSLQSEVPH